MKIVLKDGGESRRTSFCAGSGSFGTFHFSQTYSLSRFFFKVLIVFLIIQVIYKSRNIWETKKVGGKIVISH